MDLPPPRRELVEPTLPATTSQTPASTSTSTSTSTLTTTKCSSSTSTSVKRPAPSLLPAFEPLSSSPGLPRPLKRQNTGTGGTAHLKYPTPVPTSSTGILSSSPPPPRRAGLDLNAGQTARTHAFTAAERVPLSAVPGVELPENGETLCLGRSSNSSHFQLSGNRLVSRVHVRARYVAAAGPLDAPKMEVVCNGWNGLKLHCQGRTWELFKGDSFTSETEGTDLMVDVLDARVMIQWPRRAAAAVTDGNSLSDSSWDDSPPRARARGNSILQSSPLRRTTRIQSPESPTPAGGHLTSSQRLQALLPRDRDRDQGIDIYEDEPELPQPRDPAAPSVDIGMSMRTEATASFTSDLSDLDENEHDPDEENDPIIHSFGPFGADISGRMASILSKSPKVTKAAPRPRPHTTSSNETLTPVGEKTPSLPSSPSKKRPSGPGLADAEVAAAADVPLPSSPRPSIELDPAIINHVVNQLAFSRLSSTPLSTIMQNLPGEAKVGLTSVALRDAIEAAESVGIIRRQGKDAAGKALESEYYYIPEGDDDENRRAAVVDGLRKPSLRNCRKQHKVCDDYPRWESAVLTSA